MATGTDREVGAVEITGAGGGGGHVEQEGAREDPGWWPRGAGAARRRIDSCEDMNQDGSVVVVLEEKAEGRREKHASRRE